MEPSTMPIRILIVDDHEVVRQGLRVSLGVDSALEVVGEAAAGAEATSTPAATASPRLPTG